jgi:gluconokinase
LKSSPLAIVVMGVSGSGKSTFGRQLAARLSAPFLEGDDFHPPGNVQKMRDGIALRDEDRWPWLDRIAEEFAAVGVNSPLIVGACSALRRIYRDRLRERILRPVAFICLEASAQVLSARMSSRTGHFMPPALLSSQLATLEPPGADEIALSLDSTKPTDELLAQSLAWLPGNGGKMVPAANTEPR